MEYYTISCQEIPRTCLVISWKEKIGFQYLTQTCRQSRIMVQNAKATFCGNAFLKYLISVKSCFWIKIPSIISVQIKDNVLVVLITVWKHKNLLIIFSREMKYPNYKNSISSRQLFLMKLSSSYCPSWNFRLQISHNWFHQRGARTVILGPFFPSLFGRI